MKSLWHFLKRLLARLKQWQSEPAELAPLPAEENQGQNSHGAGPRRARRMAPEEDPMLKAYAWLFSARQRHEREMHFRPVGTDGIAAVETEEVRLEGNTLRHIATQTVVVTCSGEIARPEALRAVCWECRGYEATLFRCQCGRTLCHLHVRRFQCPDRTELMLCAEHFQKASAAYDTWAAHDAQQAQAMRKTA